MVEWIKANGTYNRILVTVFIGLLSFLAVKVYNKVDLMPDKFVRIERYVSDKAVSAEQRREDQTRVEAALCEIQRDVKDILRRLK